ncbi:MAG: glyoxalase [Gammaproteobacteria bacterium SG8_11]|nr:MAG: glyoxalase [Gammaproteobacteria bacterium SG8_11]
MSKPPATTGMRHVALNVSDLQACERFYVDLLGMVVEWRPDEDNVYLTSGNDNLALHRCEQKPVGQQSLDHIGFIVKAPEDVDKWYEFLGEHGVKAKSEPRTHRDGARSFYCYDPEGVSVQLIYHPPIAEVK